MANRIERPLQRAPSFYELSWSSLPRLRSCAAIPVAAVLAIFSLPASATNGVNLIGFGNESVMMGGADLAVARDTSALNTNPAGLANISGSAFDLSLTVGRAFDISHSDILGNDDESIDNRVAGYGSLGYASRIADSRWIAGAAFLVQGGVGLVYRDLNTAFGTRDDIESFLTLPKLAAGLAWQGDNGLSVGLSVSAVYAKAEQKLFPDTSFFNPVNPAQSFFGFELEDADGVGYGVRLGLLYVVNERINVGAAYASKTELNLEDGRFISNFSALGLGKVMYRDARIDGLELPQEAGLGVAFRPSEDWLIALELTWIDWSGTFKEARVRASRPDNPLAPPTLTLIAPLEWNDQYVLAIGVARQLGERTILRAGYNYGRNPIPGRTLSPLINVIGEHHLAAGVGWKFRSGWSMDAGLEYQFENSERYTNPGLPFGPGAVERNHGIALHAMLSRRW